MFWRDYLYLPDQAPGPVTMFSGTVSRQIQLWVCTKSIIAWFNAFLGVQDDLCWALDVCSMSLQPSAVWWSMSSMLFCWVTCISHIPNLESLCEILWFFGQLVSVGKTFEVQINLNHPRVSDWFVLELQLLKVHCLRGWLACGTPSRQCGNCRTSYGSAPVRTGKVLCGWLKGSVSEVYVRRLTYRFFMILPTGSQRSIRAFCTVAIFVHVLVFNAS